MNGNGAPRSGSMTRSVRRLSFSLIELLVVVAVIVLLAMMLVPAFAKVRESGRDSACRSNLHQLHVAFMGYAADNNNRLPYAWPRAYVDVNRTWCYRQGWVHWATNAPASGSIPASSAIPWATNCYWYGDNGRKCIASGSIYSYAGGTGGLQRVEVYVCPTFMLAAVSGQSDPVRSYSMNAALDYANLYANTTPSQTILLGDERLTLTAQQDPAFNPFGQLGRYHPPIAAGYNTGTGNVVYLDGHVGRP